MPVVAVVNRKGGCGKSTLAVHVAAHAAGLGLPVMLGDLDRGRSATSWLRLREAQARPALPPIRGWSLERDNVFRRPVGVSHVVLDTPAGLHGFELARVACYADAILMPLCNSAFDRASARECLAELRTMPRVASGRCRLAVVGMRLDARTRAAEVLQGWAAEQSVPFLGALRESQGYVRCIEQGLSLFDLPSAKAVADIAQWAPILEWLAPVWYPQPVQPAEPAKAHVPTPPVLKPRPLGITIPGALDDLRLPAAAGAEAGGSTAGRAVALASAQQPTGRARGPLPTPMPGGAAQATADTSGWSARLAQVWQASALHRLLARQG